MAAVPTRDPARLLVAMAAGDERAFDAFYAGHEAAVAGYFLRRTGDRELAFDLAAETFAAVVVSCGRFDPALGNPRQWLFGIAANKLRESLRKGQVEAAARQQLAMRPIQVTDDDLDRVDELASLSDEHDLAALLGDLPDRQREALLARVVAERDYEEIARSMSCSEAVVRQRVARGLRTLRRKTGVS